MVTTKLVNGPGFSTADRYVPALTGVRAVAAYLVFLHHYNPAAPDTFAYRLFDQGYVGVSIFFVLSGFLICYQYADTYIGHRNWSWKRYLQNRFARIYPLYVLLLILTVSVNAALGRPIRLPALVLNISLLKGLFEDYAFSGIAQSWSLTVEISFYLLAPFLFPLCRRWGSVLLTIALPIVGIVWWALVGQENRQVWFNHLPFVLFYTFSGRSFEFITGMWLARYIKRKPAIPTRHATLWGLFLSSICVMWQSGISRFASTGAILIASEFVVYNLLLPIGIGCIFLGLLAERSLVQRILASSVMQILGRSTYAFYLIHIGVIAKGLQKLGVNDHWLLFAILVIIANGLYAYVEKPLQQRFRA